MSIVIIFQGTRALQNCANVFFQILKSDIKEKPLGSRQTLLCFLDHFNSVGFPVVEKLQCNSVGFPVVE